MKRKLSNWLFRLFLKWKWANVIVVPVESGFPLSKVLEMIERGTWGKPSWWNRITIAFEKRERVYKGHRKTMIVPAHIKITYCDE